MALATWRSATRASCSILMRSSGSMLGSARLAHRDGQGQLAGRLPVDRALLLEQLGQVAEQRHALERVVVAGARITGIAHRLHGRRAGVAFRLGVVGGPGGRSAPGRRECGPVCGCGRAGHHGRVEPSGSRRDAAGARRVRGGRRRAPPARWGRRVLRLACGSIPDVGRVVDLDAAGPVDEPRSSRPWPRSTSLVHLGSPPTTWAPTGCRELDADRRAQDARGGRGRRGAPPGDPVERHGLRRLAQQPRAADRGGAAAARARLRLRRRPGRDRAAGGRVATRPPRRRGRRAAGHGVGRRRVDRVAGPVAVVGPGAAGQRRRPAVAVPAPRRPGRGRRPRPPPSASTGPTTWRPTAGCRRDALAELAGPVGRRAPAGRLGGPRLQAAGPGWAWPARRRARPTPSTPGWWPTTACGPPAGSRSTCTATRSTSRPIRGGRWPSMSPRRRQELSLSAVAGRVGLVGLVVGGGRRSSAAASRR